MNITIFRENGMSNERIQLKYAYYENILITPHKHTHTQQVKQIDKEKETANTQSLWFINKQYTFFGHPDNLLLLLLLL